MAEEARQLEEQFDIIIRAKWRIFELLYGEDYLKNLVAQPESITWLDTVKGIVSAINFVMPVLSFIEPKQAAVLKPALKVVQDLLQGTYVAPDSVQSIVLDMKRLVDNLIAGGELSGTNPLVQIAEADMTKFLATTNDYLTGQAAVLGTISYDGKPGHIMAIMDGGEAAQALGG